MDRNDVWGMFQHGRGHGRGHEWFFGGRHGRHRERGGPYGGPFGGGGQDGGFPFRREGRARRGDVRAAVLLLLAEQPRNGYQLMQEIEQRSSGAWRPSPGATYPALQQLEDEGLVRVETDGNGRTFHLTDKGRKEAKKHEEETAPWTAAAGEGHESAADLRDLFRQVAIAATQVARAGTTTQVAEARKVLAEARRALYRILAEDAPADDE